MSFGGRIARLLLKEADVRVDCQAVYSIYERITALPSLDTLNTRLRNEERLKVSLSSLRFSSLTENLNPLFHDNVSITSTGPINKSGSGS